MELALYIGAILIVCAIIVIATSRHSSKQYRDDADILAQSQTQGLMEPISLHPRIDPSICIGSGACVAACPTQKVLGLIHRRGHLIRPTACIGYGECFRNCPVGAISLVFGTETRGVELPHVNEDFESNIPGLYIVGELGGMGLIRNAITQGVHAMRTIAEKRRRKMTGVHDVLIVGAGPAGFAASLAAMDSRLDFITLDQEDLGGTILHYPRKKIVLTAPVELPLYGRIRLRKTTKEELLSVWEDAVAETGLTVHAREQVLDIQRPDLESPFEVTTSKATYRSHFVVLAIGRRGTPRKLEVAGEDLSKVTYRLLEPEQFAQSKCLVVGGGNSAVEAAVMLAEQPDCEVVLSYRRDVFSRIADDNRAALDRAVAARQIQLLMNSNVTEILHDSVMIEQEGQTIQLGNDNVFIFAGGQLPEAFLKKIGIEVKTAHGQVFRQG